MMLRWSFGRPDAAALIERAVRGALRDGWRTPDLMPASESAASAKQAPPNARTPAIKSAGAVAFAGAVIDHLAQPTTAGAVS
jgi:hypothetical protein